MTPERCTGLAALLMEYRDWLFDNDPGTFDTLAIEAVVNALAETRRRLVEDGAK